MVFNLNQYTEAFVNFSVSSDQLTNVGCMPLGKNIFVKTCVCCSGVCSYDFSV